MKDVTKFPENYDLKGVVNHNSIQCLDVFEEYVDFAINATISKQMPNLSEEEEKKWVGVLMTNYLNGDENAFTSSFGVRDAINGCGQNKMAEMLIKNAIERNAFEQAVFKKLIPENEQEFICEDITKKIYLGKYTEVINLVKTNPVYQKDLIDNYTEFKYRSNFKLEIARARTNVGLVKMALDNLEYGIENYNRNGQGSYSGAHR